MGEGENLFQEVFPFPHIHKSYLLLMILVSSTGSTIWSPL